MMTGCDIAWQKPSGQALASAGFTVASLYLGQDNTGKNMTASVVQDYTSHAVAVVANFEYGASQMDSGAPRGRTDALLGLSQKRAAGLPDSRPIYYSADWAATAAQILNGIIPYLVAARDVTGPGTVGVYGSYYVVKAVFEYWKSNYPGEKVWLWQTIAWSDGLIYEGIDMYQDGTTVSVSGITVDVDVLKSVDVGQFPAPVIDKDEEMARLFDVQPDPANPTVNIGIWAAVEGVGYFHVLDPADLATYRLGGTPEGSISFAQHQAQLTAKAVTVNVDSAAIASAIVTALEASSLKFPTSFSGSLS